MNCPGCSGPLTTHNGVTAGSGFVYSCRDCGALVATHVFRGDSYQLVRPEWAHDYDPADQRYFDITGIGSNGVYRRHGWYIPSTRLITQVG